MNTADYPVTVESIQRAKEAQQREREQFVCDTGLLLTSDGRIITGLRNGLLISSLLWAGLFSVACPSHAHAQEPTHVSNKLYAAFLGIDSLNETLTLVNMSHGLRELNPAFPSHNKAGHIATFAAFQVLDVYALKRVEQKNPTLAKALLIGLIGAQSAIAGWELHNLKH